MGNDPGLSPFLIRISRRAGLRILYNKTSMRRENSEESTYSIYKHSKSIGTGNLGNVAPSGHSPLPATFSHTLQTCICQLLSCYLGASLKYITTVLYT